MKNEPQGIGGLKPQPRNPQIDFDLCELTGEGYADFIVLHVNGEPMKGFGTPYATAGSVAQYSGYVAALNAEGSKDLPLFLDSWRIELSKQFGLSPKFTAADFRPVFSIQISRVCAGYSEHLHCAIRLFEKYPDLAKEWRLWLTGAGDYVVDLWTADGRAYTDRGESAALIITRIFVRVLRLKTGWKG